ncbi:MAG: IclR family transcriptional regulator [Actinomycetota bacterium]|nr:IclR family transcriptional regulator [Actinomycetota bacterium]
MKVLSKCFGIIDLIKSKDMNLTEISKELNINKSTAYSILKDLQKFGYVYKLNTNKKYRLGYKFFEIYNYLITKIDLMKEAEKIADELNILTNETIHVGTFISSKVYNIYKKESDKPIRVYIEGFKEVPIYCTGIGKAILANQKKEKIDEILNKLEFKKYTKNTITDMDDLRRELEKIKNSGYAIDNEEHQENVCCIATPVRNYTNEVVASISITSIKYKTDVDYLVDKYKSLIMQKGFELSLRLGYNND